MHTISLAPRLGGIVLHAAAVPVLVYAAAAVVLHLKPAAKAKLLLAVAMASSMVPRPTTSDPFLAGQDCIEFGSSNSQGQIEQPAGSTLRWNSSIL